MRISILCPTKGRVKRAREMRDSAILTARRPRDLEFVFYVDKSDLVSVRSLFSLMRPHGGVATTVTQVIIDNQEMNLSNMWNVCWSYASGDIFMLAADDIVFRTTGWDSRIVKEFEKIPDRIAYVFAHDGYPNYPKGPNRRRNFGTHGFVHKNWTDVLGYFTPPYFERRCTDSWLDFLGGALKRKVPLQDVLIEHMHWQYGKSENDDTYKEQYNMGTAYRPIWHNSYQERMGHVEKLREFIEEFNENSPDKST